MWYEKHWHTKWWKTRIYRIRSWIQWRCNCISSSWYKLYGWRWIKCEWKSFGEFYKSMHESYLDHVEKYWEKETTIDRIDFNWNYIKDNCRWATYKEQANNRSNIISRLILLDRYVKSHIMFTLKTKQINHTNKRIPIHIRFIDIINDDSFIYKWQYNRSKIDAIHMLSRAWWNDEDIRNNWFLNLKCQP